MSNWGATHDRAVRGKTDRAANAPSVEPDRELTGGLTSPLATTRGCLAPGPPQSLPAIGVSPMPSLVGGRW